MKYIKLFEENLYKWNSLECEYKIGEYVMYINKERVFDDQFTDKPELAKILDILDPDQGDITNGDNIDEVNIYKNN
jgi:hypothetical protein